MKYLNLTFLIIFLLISSNAYSTINYYKVREGDTIHNIFRAYFQTVYSGNEVNDLDIDVKLLAQNLKKLNPKVKDWKSLKPGTIIIVPSNINQTKQKLSLGVFYTASQGKFSEVLTQSSSLVNSSQISPVTFGFMSQFQFGGSNIVIPSSIYFSKLIGGKVRGLDNDVGKISIPMEIGGNLYAQYSISSLALSPFFGFDFERFTTFNMSDLENGAPLSARQNSLIYATVGVGHNFSIGPFHLYVKGSLSKSVSCTTTSDNSADSFSGYRGLLYLNIKMKSPFLVHFFYKHHDLVGPTKLKIDRVGAGVGYFFF